MYAIRSYYVNRIRYKYDVDPIDKDQWKIGRENRLFVEQIEPGLVRVHNHGAKIPQTGLVLVCKGSQSENRLSYNFV